MPKICAIPQLVSAPLNLIPITDHFRSSHVLLLSMLDVQIWCSTIFEIFAILKRSWLEWILQNQVSARRLELNKIIFRQIAPTLYDLVVFKEISIQCHDPELFLLSLCPLLFHSFPIQSNFKDNIWHKFSRAFFLFFEFLCFISIFHLWATASKGLVKVFKHLKRSFQKFGQQEMLIIWSSKNKFKHLNTEGL